MTPHVYEVRPRKDKRGVDLISDVLPFGRLWYGESNAVANAIGYAMQSSRSHDAAALAYITRSTFPDGGYFFEKHFDEREKSSRQAAEIKPSLVEIDVPIVISKARGLNPCPRAGREPRNFTPDRR